MTRHLRTGIRGTVGNIDPPASYPDVVDASDPILGASEIPPCPGADGVGTLYAVGDARETWERVSVTGRFGVRAPDGTVHLSRKANEALLSRGARILLLVRHGAPMVRANIGAPLQFVDDQASLFAGSSR